MQQPIFRTVYKYMIPLEGEFTLELPAGAKIRHFGIQDGSPKIWAEVNPFAPLATRSFRLIGTGRPLEPGLGYFGTAIMQLSPTTLPGNSLVWHLYESNKYIDRLLRSEEEGNESEEVKAEEVKEIEP